MFQYVDQGQNEVDGVAYVKRKRCSRTGSHIIHPWDDPTTHRLGNDGPACCATVWVLRFALLVKGHSSLFGYPMLPASGPLVWSGQEE